MPSPKPLPTSTSGKRTCSRIPAEPPSQDRRGPRSAFGADLVITAAFCRRRAQAIMGPGATRCPYPPPTMLAEGPGAAAGGPRMLELVALHARPDLRA